MNPGPAFRSKRTWPATVFPVIPGAAALALTASTEAHSSAPIPSSRRSGSFLMTACMSNLLGARAPLSNLGIRIDRSADVDLGHHAAEVLGVVRQVIELRGVQIELLSRLIVDRKSVV